MAKQLRTVLQPYEKRILSNSRGITQPSVPSNGVKDALTRSISSAGTLRSVLTLVSLFLAFIVFLTATGSLSMHKRCCSAIRRLNRLLIQIRRA